MEQNWILVDGPGTGFLYRAAVFARRSRGGATVAFRIGIIGIGVGAGRRRLASGNARSHSANSYAPVWEMALVYDGRHKLISGFESHTRKNQDGAAGKAPALLFDLESDPLENTLATSQQARRRFPMNNPLLSSSTADISKPVKIAVQ